MINVIDTSDMEMDKRAIVSLVLSNFLLLIACGTEMIHKNF